MKIHNINVKIAFIRTFGAVLLIGVTILAIIALYPEETSNSDKQAQELLVQIPDDFVEEAFTSSQITHDEVFIYKSYGNKSCAIIGVWDESKTEIQIPTRNPSGDTVVEISENAFGKCQRLMSVTISQTILEIAPNAFSECKNLVVILTSSSNPRFCSVGGVLHSKDKTELICYPANRAGDNYLLNTNVKRIGSYAFYNVKNLKKVLFEGSIDDFESIYIGLGNDVFKKMPITCNYISTKS